MPDGYSHLTLEKADLTFDGIDDLIRLCLEDPERVPVFDGEVNVIIVDDRDPEWSAGNLIRGAKLLRDGKQILVHQVTHRA
jgi:hypothetical protein